LGSSPIDVISAAKEGAMSLGTAPKHSRSDGRTPLLHLKRLHQSGTANVYAKLEYLNPGGSVKDRAALGLVLDAEERSLIGPGSTIIEPTAGIPVLASL